MTDSHFEIPDLENFLQLKYGIEGMVVPLEGHVDKNFQVLIDNNPEYVLKLSADLTEKPFLEAQMLILEQLKVLNEKYAFPQVIPGFDGRTIYLYTANKGIQFLARLFNFLPGKFLAESDKNERLLFEFGTFMGHMDMVLQKIQHPEIIARHYEWDLRNFPEYREYLKNIPDASKRKLIAHFLLQYNENVQPCQHRIRKSIIHNDANDRNILSDDRHIIGAIDFGDIVQSFTIGELVIGATYIALGEKDPVDKISNVLKGYHSIFPVREIEISTIYYLIAARLCMSACQSAYHKQLRPKEKYLTVHEQAVWDLLEKWIALSPDLAEKSFRQACGYESGNVRDVQQYLDRRDQYFSKSLSLSYAQPIVMQKAAFQYMFDSNGRTYLDCVNNIMHVGHCHPHVVEAGQKQMASLNTNTRYLYDAMLDYAEKLLARFPSQLEKVFFVNSGSAASDLAIRLARNFTEKKELIVMDHGYHGNTGMAIAISPYKFQGKGGKGPESFVHIAGLPGIGIQTNPSEKDLLSRIDLFMENPVAAFICEPIVGCGGQVMLSESYLQGIYQRVRAKGGVCIADEVQTGFGRVGSTFWAYELYEVIPDIVVLGKPMGNGHPIGAVVTTRAISDAFENGMEFFSSFGGNPVSCRIGEAVLEVISQESLQENALTVGENLKSGFRKLQKEYPVISDVRGSGLFLGIELSNYMKDGAPATKAASWITNAMRARGILLSTDGPNNNVIKIKPPLCFSLQNAEQLLTVFEETIRTGASLNYEGGISS